MEIRFNTINKGVEEVLEQIDKQNRKYFVETAILHYIKYLEETGAIDLFYNSREKDKSTSKTKEKEEVEPKEVEPKKEVKQENKATDNSSLADESW